MVMIGQDRFIGADCRSMADLTAECLFAVYLRSKTVSIATSQCRCLEELASMVLVVRSKISGHGL